VSPGQVSSEGVPRAWKILPSWSMSVSPGNQGRLRSSSGREEREGAREGGFGGMMDEEEVRGGCMWEKRRGEEEGRKGK
jgi:hypothetical protein